MYYGMGDYYGQGDPGLWDVVKGVARGAAGFLTGGPVGAAAAVIPGIRGGRATRSGVTVPEFGRSLRLPTGYSAGGAAPGMGVRRKRRRINYANDKALKRAIRRQDGFVKLARKALKGSGYTIVSKSSQARRRGSRGVITEAEAKRALRS